MSKQLIGDTQGAIYDEKGNFFTYDVVKKVLSDLDYKKFLNYPELTGGDEFKTNTLNWIFGDNLSFYAKKYDIKVLPATGNGECISLILDKNNKFTTLLPDICWHNFFTIAKEANNKYITFNFLDKNNNFDIKSFKDSISKILNNEKGINIVLNDPIHNPTGIVLTKQQYIVICKFLNTFKNKTINLILDTAYIDYLNNNNNKHDIFSYISSLDKNINVYVCYSFSKTLCIYGLRVASLVILSKNSEQIYLELQEKIKSTVFRCSSSGIYVVNKILSSKTLLTQYKKQLSNIKKMLLKRMTLFLSEAKKCNLSYVNCSSGFFVTVLCKNPSVIVEQLPNYKSVLRAQNNSLRIGICGMTCSQIKGLAEKIKALTTK